MLADLGQGSLGPGSWEGPRISLLYNLRSGDIGIGLPAGGTPHGLSSRRPFYGGRPPDVGYNVLRPLGSPPGWCRPNLGGPPSRSKATATFTTPYITAALIDTPTYTPPLTTVTAAIRLGEPSHIHGYRISFSSSHAWPGWQVPADVV